MRNLGKFLTVALFAMPLMFAGFQARAIAILPTANDTDGIRALVDAIIGSGITLVGTPTLFGEINQQGTFTLGVDEVGFASGIVLSSGNVNQIPGANSNTDLPETRGTGGPQSTLGDDISTNLRTDGDADLTAIAGNTTFDANVLEFSFEFGDGTQGGNSLFFNFVFASEEYIDFIGSAFNDAFAFILDGTTNLATVGGSPITVNNINDVSNSGSYINNVANTNGIPDAGLLIAFDGLTTVLQAQATDIGPGTHTIKLAVADTFDGILDAGVFIQAGTFSGTPTNGIPEPGTLVIFGFGLAALGFMRRRRAA